MLQHKNVILNENRSWHPPFNKSTSTNAQCSAALLIKFDEDLVISFDSAFLLRHLKTMSIAKQKLNCYSIK